MWNRGFPPIWFCFPPLHEPAVFPQRKIPNGCVNRFLARELGTLGTKNIPSNRGRGSCRASIATTKALLVIQFRDKFISTISPWEYPSRSLFKVLRIRWFYHYRNLMWFFHYTQFYFVTPMYHDFWNSMSFLHLVAKPNPFSTTAGGVPSRNFVHLFYT